MQLLKPQALQARLHKIAMDHKAKVTVTQADCIRETFRCGGNGGQNLNKRDTGVRFRHPPSGAVGEARDQRTQLQNEKLAWRRMGESKEFQAWARLQLAMLEEGYRNVDRKVDALMADENLTVEVGVPAKRGDLTE
jgi:protein subunit release factor B